MCECVSVRVARPHVCVACACGVWRVRVRVRVCVRVHVNVHVRVRACVRVCVCACVRVCARVIVVLIYPAPRSPTSKTYNFSGVCIYVWRSMP